MATPIDRLRQKFSGLLEPVNPRNPPEVPSELKEWAANVSGVVSACMAVAAAREASRVRADPIQVPTHLPPVLHDMYLRNQQSGRASKVASRALAGGWHALMFGGLLYGVESLLHIAFDARRKEHTAIGGLAAGGVYGMLLPGSLMFRISRAGVGAAAGVVVGGIAGFLQHDVVQYLKD